MLLFEVRPSDPCCENDQREHLHLYRFFNWLKQAIQPHRFPLPLPEDIFTFSDSPQCFSKLHLAEAYCWMPAETESQLLTISTHCSPDQYTRLPFGMKTASRIFQRPMDAMISGLECMDAYHDDTVFSVLHLKIPTSTSHNYSCSVKNMIFELVWINASFPCRLSSAFVSLLIHTADLQIQTIYAPLRVCHHREMPDRSLESSVTAAPSCWRCMVSVHH